MTFFPANFATETFAIEKKMHFRVKKLSRLKKSDRKNTIFYSFSVLLMGTVTIYKVFLLKRLKIGLIKKQQHKILKKRKNWKEKTFASQQFSVISRAQTFANFDLRLCLGRNFREKCQKTRKLRNFLPAKVSAPKVVKES